MKTLFIQTHELAKNLNAHDYTCHQLESYLCQSHGMKHRAASTTARIVMGMLYKEQKEHRKFDYSTFHVLEDILDVHKVEGEPHIIYATNRVIFSSEQLKGIRQRLINSLLTRPDRTLCVLIPEYLPRTN